MQTQLTRGEADNAGEELAADFRSADSVPAGFAIARPAWLTPLFLISVAAASALIIGNTDLIGRAYKDVLATVNALPSSAALGLGSLGFRPFFAMLIVLIGLFSGGPLRGRLRFTLPVLFVYLLGVLVSDSLYLRFQGMGAPPPFSAAGNVTAGFIGVLGIAVGVFTLFHLPADSVVHKHVHRRFRRYVITLLISMVLGLAVAFLAFNYAAGFVDALRGVTLLGGLGPGLALFLPTVLVTLFFTGWVSVTFTRLRRMAKRQKANPQHLPRVAFLVAAYNESEQIEECIRALDRAASRYDGVARLYLVDNASEDDTVAIAERTIGSCETFNHDTDHILHCQIKGKSHALNYGLERINEEIVVRVDADTVVEPALLQKAIPYFEDPSVGGVTGMPLPKRRFSLMGLLRTIEVYYNVGFNRVAQSAIDAVMVLPGIMSAYRRDPLVRLGGFAEGINGEDTDMSVRIGRLGYRLLVDPDIRMYTEVPSSFAHLREQRLRWSRSLYHVAARNMSAIKMRQGTRGVWVLSWAVYFSSRRLIVLPMVVYALLLLINNPSDPALRQGAAIGAVVIGPQVFVLAVTLFLYGKFLYIPLIPGFLVFRVLRTYFALESFFTLPTAAPMRQAVAEPAGRRGPLQGFPGGIQTAPAQPAPAPAVRFVPERAPVQRAGDIWSMQPTTDDGITGQLYPELTATGIAPESWREADTAWQVPANHPIRRVKSLMERTLDWLSPTFDGMSGERQKLLQPATTVKASTLMALHAIDDEALFCDHLKHNRISMWFMDMEPGFSDFDAQELKASRQRLMTHDAARQLVNAVTRDARRRGLYPGSPLLHGGPAGEAQRVTAAGPSWAST